MTALPSWHDTETTRAILAFVEAATREGDPGFVRPAERIAVFDNDGTLWTEKPMPVQLDFIVRSFAAAAERDPGLRERQPYKAAYEHDMGWLGRAMVKHYQGDDSDLKLLFGALSETSADVDVEAYAEQVAAFFEDAEHPTLRRPYVTCGFVPMVELLRHLEANGFLTFIVSGGDRDFMRPAAEKIYGIPRERVVGSGFGTAFADGRITYTAKLDAFDDGPQKPNHPGAHGPPARDRVRNATATSRCCASPAGRTSPRCGSWCGTTTPLARSTTRAAPMPSSAPASRRSACATTGASFSPTLRGRACGSLEPGRPRRACRAPEPPAG